MLNLLLLLHTILLLLYLCVAIVSNVDVVVSIVVLLFLLLLKLLKLIVSVLVDVGVILLGGAVYNFDVPDGGVVLIVDSGSVDLDWCCCHSCWWSGCFRC